jgi:hypothetical protein
MVPSLCFLTTQLIEFLTYCLVLVNKNFMTEKCLTKLLGIIVSLSTMVSTFLSIRT